MSRSLDRRMASHARDLFGANSFAKQLDDGRVTIGVEGAWAVEGDDYLQCWEAARFIIDAAAATGVNISCAADPTAEIQYLPDGGAGGGEAGGRGLGES